MLAQTLAFGAPLAQARAVVLLAHGRGGSASDMRGLALSLEAAGVRYVLPQAPGDSWYPLGFLSRLADNEPKLSRSLDAYAALIDELLAAGVAAARLVLAGFSQGACLTAETAARHPRRYGGVVLFTGGVIGPPDTVWPVSAGLAGTPVLIGASKDRKSTRLNSSHRH